MSNEMKNADKEISLENLEEVAGGNTHISVESMKGKMELDLPIGRGGGKPPAPAPMKPATEG